MELGKLTAEDNSKYSVNSSFRDSPSLFDSTEEFSQEVEVANKKKT